MSAAEWKLWAKFPLSALMQEERGGVMSPCQWCVSVLYSTSLNWFDCLENLNDGSLFMQVSGELQFPIESKVNIIDFVIWLKRFDCYKSTSIRDVAAQRGAKQGRNCVVCLIRNHHFISHVDLQSIFLVYSSKLELKISWGVRQRW